MLVACAFGVMSKNPLSNSKSQRFIPKSSSKSIIVIAFTFRSLIHFELIFVYDVKEGTNFILLHVAIQLS